MTEHDVLVAAKSYLLNHGWMQGDYGEDGGPRCALGALKSARDVLFGDDHPATKRLAAIVGDWCVCDWNDADDRTFDDVIAAFDEAILATAPAETPQPEKALA